MSDLRWYVIQCKPKQESRAFEHLTRQGFSCYLPTLRVEKPRVDRWIKVREPLFPGYLFIRLDQINQNWHPIRSTRGVIQLVRFRDYPLPIADEIIEQISARLAQDGTVARYFRAGENVRITEGPFSNFEGIFLSHDGEERVVLLMKILQRDQELRFPIGSVRKCASA